MAPILKLILLMERLMVMDFMYTQMDLITVVSLEMESLMEEENSSISSIR